MADLKRRVLVVDDELDWCNEMRRFLEFSGYDAEIANDIDEAIEKITHADLADKRFSIITIDMGFEKGNGRFQIMSGKELLMYVKKKFPYLACIMISARTQKPNQVLDLRDEYQLDYFLQKAEFDTEEFKWALQKAEQRVSETTFSPQPISLPPSKQSPKVFISYRRSVNWWQARAIANSLQSRGVDVFLDIDSINSGRFPEKITSEIHLRKFFLPILSPTTLESDWVKTEISQAIVREKIIIPILIDGYTLEADKLPFQFRSLAEWSGIVFSPEFYDAGMDRLVERFLTDD